MRASLSDLIRALYAHEPPHRIWQQPFKDDPSRLKQLLHLRGTGRSYMDLCLYAEYMQSSPLQPDLFRYLLPICLEAWRTNLLANDFRQFGAFVEYFWSALANTTLLHDNLNLQEYTAVEKFLVASILDAMDQDNSLSFSGTGASPYTLFAALSSLCVVFPALASLWKDWWEMRTVGHACAALQVLSCLLYEDDSNPIFAPWTPHGGGGPPRLWELIGHIYDRGWRVENVAFLQATLTPDYLQDRLRTAAQIIDNQMDCPVPRRMLTDFETQKPLLESRLAELPSLLLMPSDPALDWTR